MGLIAAATAGAGSAVRLAGRRDVRRSRFLLTRCNSRSDLCRISVSNDTSMSFDAPVGALCSVHPGGRGQELAGGGGFGGSEAIRSDDDRS